MAGMTRDIHIRYNTGAPTWATSRSNTPAPGVMRIRAWRDAVSREDLHDQSQPWLKSRDYDRTTETLAPRRVSQTWIVLAPVDRRSILNSSILSPIVPHNGINANKIFS